MTERVGHIESWIEGPRFAAPKTALMKAAMAYDLTVDYIREEKGWLRTTVFFKFSGTESNLNSFSKAWKQAITEWNKD